MRGLHKHLKALEVSLHKTEVRCCRESLEMLLHPSFKEIGYSGTTHNFKSILKTLTHESTSGIIPVIWSQDFEFADLSPEIVQIWYLSAQEKEGVLVRHAKRTSIWVNDSLIWRMQYHQATPICTFEKNADNKQL